MLQASLHHTCLAGISLDSAFKNDKNYYLEAFLKECKYIDKEVIRHITEDLEIFSDESDEFDEE